MHVGDQAVQEQNGANINPRANVRRLELFCPRNRHSLSYLRCRHLIPATSLTPTSPTPPLQSLTDSHCGYLTISLFWL